MKIQLNAKTSTPDLELQLFHQIPQMCLKFLQTRKRKTGNEILNKLFVTIITIRNGNFEIMISIFFFKISNLLGVEEFNRVDEILKILQSK